MGVRLNPARTGTCNWKSCGKLRLPGWTTCKKHRDAGREVKVITPRMPVDIPGNFTNRNTASHYRHESQ